MLWIIWLWMHALKRQKCLYVKVTGGHHLPIYRWILNFYNFSFLSKIKQISFTFRRRHFQHKWKEHTNKFIKLYSECSLRQSKTSLQKGFFKLTEISLSFSFCRYKTLSPPYCLRYFPYYLLWKNRGVQFVSDLINHENKQFYS
jgi:hypothetical protein